MVATVLELQRPRAAKADSTIRSRVGAYAFASPMLPGRRHSRYRPFASSSNRSCPCLRIPATRWLTARDADAVTESGKPVKNARGVKFVRSEGGSTLFEVESGAYAFASLL